MKYKKVFPHIMLAILVSVFVFLNDFNIQKKIVQAPWENNKIESDKTKETARITRVIDGDTIEVDLNGKKAIVRLIGIDAPEAVDPRKRIQCFGIEALYKAREMLNNQTVELESDSTQENKDKYGRLLRYVFLNGINFNKIMILDGYAHEYTYKNSPYKYQQEFKNAAREALENEKGLFKKCDKI